MEDLEINLNIDELKAIIEASRKREFRQNEFLAALQGVELDGGANSAKEKFDEIQRRVESKLSGKTADELEFNELGFELETE